MKFVIGGIVGKYDESWLLAHTFTVGEWHRILRIEALQQEKRSGSRNDPRILEAEVSASRRVQQAGTPFVAQLDERF